MNYKFEIPGPPQGKGRPRFAQRGNKKIAYTPVKTRNYERDVREACAAAAPGLIRGAACVRIIAYYPIPESWTVGKKGKCLAQMIYPVVKPDADNVIKAILDGMNGVAWGDDKQVTHVGFDKVYSDVPRVVVEVWEAQNDTGGRDFARS